MSFTPSRSDLERMFPRALPAWLDALEKLAPVLGHFYDFQRLEWAHFCGQIHAETSGLSLKTMQESMNFTTQKRILEVYRYRLGVAIKKVDSGKEKEPAIAKGKSVEQLAKLLIRKPKLLADIVYGGREGTPWMQGSRYLGRGPTQITHKNNYEAVGKEIARQPGGGIYDLVKNPELLSTDPELGIRSAFADWHLKNLSRWAEADDCDTLSDMLNTGNIRDNVKPHGLTMRRQGTASAKDIWQGQIAFGPPAVTPEAPKPVVASAPAEPVTADDLVGASRKVTLLVRVKQLFAWTGIGGGGAYTFADITGQGKETAHALADLFKDNAAILLVGGLVVGFVLAHLLVNWMVEDANDGRYVAKQPVDGIG